MLILCFLMCWGCNRREGSMSHRDFARWCMEQGRATNYTHADTLSVEQWKRAKAWIDRHGSPEDRAQVALFLGRAYAADEAYDQAMDTYVKALDFAKGHEAYNIAGYICTYMADLYNFKGLLKELRAKYAEAADWFAQADNRLSQAYALKNLAMEYAYVDSFALAKHLMQQVDSLAQQLNVQRLNYNIANAYANIYYKKQSYDSAIYYFHQAISLDIRHGRKDSVGLANSYWKSGQPELTKKLVDQMYPNEPGDFTLNELYVVIYKAKKDFEKALHHKEISFDIYDSITTAQLQAQVLREEKKYNHLKLQEENQRLENANLRYLIYTLSSISIAVIGGIIFFFYRKSTQQKLRWQTEKLDNLDKERNETAFQLKEAQQALKTVQVDKQEESLRLQGKIELLTERYKQLQKQRLETSSVYKKLTTLCSKKRPDNNKPLLTAPLWRTLTTEIHSIYPDFHTRLLDSCPGLTEEEWRYCNLHLLGFDSNDEALLLGILPGSVLMKRSRIKQKIALNKPKEATLHDILSEYYLS